MGACTQPGYGADPRLANDGGVTALRMAYLTHRIDIVNILQEITQEALLGDGKEEGTACSTAQNKLKTTANVIQFVRKPEQGVGAVTLGEQKPH